jgi:hypothetical protein
MTKMNWFYKNQISFEWKYWMTLYAFWIKFELNWNQIPKFNSNTLNGIPISIQQLKLKLNWIEIKIELNWNEMQIGGEGMENLLVNVVLKNKL